MSVDDWTQSDLVVLVSLDELSMLLSGTRFQTWYWRAKETENLLKRVYGRDDLSLLSAPKPKLESPNPSALRQGQRHNRNVCAVSYLGERF